jgi:hypothetical protein
MILDEFGSNSPVNIASVKGKCAVAIVVTPDINDVSVLWEDGITNIHCHAIAAIATVATTACQR